MWPHRGAYHGASDRRTEELSAATAAADAADGHMKSRVHRVTYARRRVHSEAEPELQGGWVDSLTKMESNYRGETRGIHIITIIPV